MLATRQVPLLDLKAQHAAIREDVIAAMLRVVDSQKFILGEEVAQFEREFAAYSGAAHAIGCASGSDALFLALLGLGIGSGDEVLTSPYTFFATVGAIVRAGATPVFADVEESTFNLDIAHVERVLAARPKIKALIPVHLFGACADMDPLMEMATRRGIKVIEDAAQTVGGEYKGRRAGSIGDVACFSFFPSKNLGAYGDGGMLTTSDPALADRLAALRVHGGKKKYYHEMVGINSRLDALQAAVLRVKFRHLDSWTEGRQRNAARYREILPEAAPQVVLPQPSPSTTRHIYNQFVICAPGRDQLQAYLKENQIGTEVYYPVPMHLQPCFSNLGHKKGDFPVSERLASESLALPVHSELSEDDLYYVCETIGAFYR
jgi:dTDP-4-amino-4,6-dideoxygalactose transaminase